MTIANILTLFRILILIPFIGMFYVDASWANWVAVVIYVVACLTDYLDGILARQFNEESPLGKFLDPIADKLLISITIVMLAATGRLEGYMAVLPALIILAREIFISGLREHLSLENINVPVSLLAKWKTATQMVSLSYLLADGPKKYIWGFHEVGVVLLWGAAVLSVISGYEYWRKGRSVINP
jgi:cardiolipin synthase (CMP-forming)